MSTLARRSPSSTSSLRNSVWRVRTVSDAWASCPTRSRPAAGDELPCPRGHDALRLRVLQAPRGGEVLDDVRVLEQRRDEVGDDWLDGEEVGGVRSGAGLERRRARGVERREGALFLAGKFAAPGLDGVVVAQDKRVDRVTEQQRERCLVAGLHRDVRRERAVEVALGFLLKFQEALRGLGRAGVGILELRERVAAGQHLLVDAAGFAARLLGIALLALGLAAGLLGVLERLAAGAEEILGIGELGLLRLDRGLRFVALQAEGALLGLQRLEPELEVALLQLERGELLLLPLVQALLRKLLLLELGALGLDVADAGR